MGKRLAVAILLCILLMASLFLSRYLVLLSSEHVYDDEEIKTGSIAYAVTRERELPLMDYQPGDYEGGTFLYGLLAVPFFQVFGSTRLALKMLALTTVLLLTFAALLYARSHSGRPGAAAVAVLFVLPAPYLVQVGLIPWGNYAENAMLTMLAFVAAAKILIDEKPGRWTLLLWGALCGLGVYVHYGFLVTIVYLLFLWMLVRPRSLFSARAWWWVAGFFLGFWPWLLYNATHHWRGLTRLGQGMAGALELEERLAVFALNFARLWGNDLAAGFHFSFASPTIVRVVSYMYYLLLIGLIVALVALRRKEARRILSAIWPWDERPQPDASFWMLAPLGYVVFYTAVYSFSDYGLHVPTWGAMNPESHAHIFAVYPMLTLAAGMAAGAAWTTSWRRPVMAAVAALAILGLVGMFALADGRDAAQARLRSPAYSLDGLYAEIGQKYAIDAEEMACVRERLSTAKQFHFVYGAGIRLGIDLAADPEAAVARGQRQPGALRPAYWLGVGAGYFSNKAVSPEKKDASLARIVEPARSWFVFGACLGSLWIDREHPTCLDADGQAEKLKRFAESQPELQILIESRLSEIHLLQQ